MASQTNRAGRGWRLVAMAALGGVTVACNPDSVLDVVDPDVLNTADFTGPAGAAPLRFGVLQEFSVTLSGSTTGSMVMMSANMSDEAYSVDTFDDRLLPNARQTDEVLPGLGAPYRDLHRARASAERAALILQEVAPEDPENIGEVLSILGFTQTLFGEIYCSGVPFSVENGVTTEFGESQTTTEVFELSVASFNAALASTGGVAQIANLAAVGKGRALLNLGRFAEAAAAVSSVPTNFKYEVFHSLNTGRQQNGIWNALSQDGSRYAIINNEGGTPLEWFQTPADPRMPWEPSSRDGFNGTSSNLPTQLKYLERNASVVVADGIEARLIELEAELQAGTQAARDAVFAGLNDLRATGRDLGIDPIATAPTTQAAAVDLLFQERAYWMWLTAHRLGDLRRMIRQYGRSADSVFPTGDTPPGVAANVYGDDVNYIIPIDERNNPNFNGCLDRNA